MSITPDVEMRKQQFAEAKERYHELLHGCRHHVDGKSKTYCGCAICGEYVGWHCDYSPDGVCHSASQNGNVELIDKTWCPIPDGHDTSKEVQGWCIFCEQHVDNREGAFTRCARCDRRQVQPMAGGRYWCGWCNDWARERTGLREPIAANQRCRALTPEQEEYKRQMAEASACYRELLRNCRHFAHTDYGACVICGKKLGWICPISPDRVCHYWSQDGYVELVDRTMVPVPKGHDASNELDEWCIFCGEPKERK